MDRIVEAVMIYYNYFIPVHGDGRTAAEFLAMSPPAWLSILIAANKEKEMPFREAKTLEEDSSHFQGMLVSGIAQDIMERGGRSERAKVVMRIMEELEKDSGRRDELKVLQGDAYRGRSRGEAKRESAGRFDEALGRGESGKQDAPRVVIPFVTIYRVEKKDRVRALLQTYRGNIAVHFFGKENTVELERDTEDQRTWAAYCHPRASGDEKVQVGTRLGVIRLDRDLLDLSSIVEERHRALRDFVAKLVGQRSMHLVREVKNAIIDPDAGEGTTQEIKAQDEAIAMTKKKSLDQLNREGLEECTTAGIIISPKNGAGLPRTSPIFAAEVLDRYRKSSESGTSPKAEALREAIISATMNRLRSSAEPSKTVYRATLTVMALAEVIMDGAMEDGADRAADVLRRIIDLEPMKDDALPPLIEYLEDMTSENRDS